MKLNKLELEDRSFLIQLDEIFKEFWGHIPWLLSYYSRFGFEIVNNMPNRDWLYSITSDEKLFTKRH